jgi:RimJ/RimL family protein N-acetyltransferase
MDVCEKSAIITWGPSIIIGGEFSCAMGEILKGKLQSSRSTRYISSPEGEWGRYIESTFPGGLTKKQNNSYLHPGVTEENCPPEHEKFIQITADWLNSGLPAASIIKNEIYSYSSAEDFLQNGFGLALMIDDTLCGYCLSEYSADNECAITIWVDEKHRGLGYATKKKKTFLHHNKNRKVYWVCNSDNIASNKVAKKAGFVLQSKLKYHEFQGETK